MHGCYGIVRDSSVTPHRQGVNRMAIHASDNVSLWVANP
ncbi:hypothetical protein PCLA_24r0034 [Pseudomonas citronellolis]|nr:hypothetical protein PCLA_24r0034 [Pseudomonas citronellolis]